jgi:hypothetical protein
MPIDSSCAEYSTFMSVNRADMAAVAPKASWRPCLSSSSPSPHLVLRPHHLVDCLFYLAEKEVVLLLAGDHVPSDRGRQGFQRFDRPGGVVDCKKQGRWISRSRGWPA